MTAYSYINLMIQSMVVETADIDNLVADQCALVLLAAEHLVNCLGDPAAMAADHGMGALDKQERKSVLHRNLELLSRCPPPERHEWLRAVVALDNLIGRMDEICNEVILLHGATDPIVQEMARLIHAAAEALQSGFGNLGTMVASVQHDASVIAGLVDTIELHDTHALKKLFMLEKLDGHLTPETVLAMVKKWMIHHGLCEVKQLLSTGGESMLALALMREARLTARRHGECAP